jgi:hypothetical protein
MACLLLGVWVFYLVMFFSLFRHVCTDSQACCTAHPPVATPLAPSATPDDTIHPMPLAVAVYQLIPLLPPFLHNLSQFYSTVSLVPPIVFQDCTFRTTSA